MIPARAERGGTRKAPHSVLSRATSSPGANRGSGPGASPGSSPAAPWQLTDVGGLRVASQYVPGVRSVSLGVWIGVGSGLEDDGDRGYAHFLEHMLFKGDADRDAEAVSRYFDRIGSDANAATTKEFTVVHARVLDRHVAGSLDVIGGMVIAPALRDGEVESEREVVLEEIAMYDDSPADVVHELADELAFGTHPLGLPIVGTRESIGAVDATAIGRFHRDRYRPGSMVISAAGNIGHDDLVALVSSAFVGDRVLPSDTGNAGVDVTRGAGDIARGAVAIQPRRARLRIKDTEQVHLAWVGRGLARDDPRRHALALLDTVLGATASSRLFSEVRERRGLAYSVYTWTSGHAHTGQVGAYVGVRPDRVRAALRVVRDELARFADAGPTQEELDRAREHLEGRMLLSLESTGVRSNRLGSALVTGMPVEEIDDVVARLRGVTRDDVHDLARELFAPDVLSLAVVAEDAGVVAGPVADELGLDLDLANEPRSSAEPAA